MSKEERSMKNTRRALAFVALSATLAIPTLSEAAAQKTIAFMRGGPDPYYQYGMNAAQAAADKLGVKLVTYSANRVGASAKPGAVQSRRSC
jgi:ABC-type sugar transport system substrate-binding protein